MVLVGVIEGGNGVSVEVNVDVDALRVGVKVKVVVGALRVSVEVNVSEGDCATCVVGSCEEEYHHPNPPNISRARMIPMM